VSKLRQEEIQTPAMTYASPSQTRDKMLVITPLNYMHRSSTNCKSRERTDTVHHAAL